MLATNPHGFCQSVESYLVCDQFLISQLRASKEQSYNFHRTSWHELCDTDVSCEEAQYHLCLLRPHRHRRWHGQCLIEPTLDQEVGWWELEGESMCLTTSSFYTDHHQRNHIWLSETITPSSSLIKETTQTKILFLWWDIDRPASY